MCITSILRIVFPFPVMHKAYYSFNSISPSHFNGGGARSFSEASYRRGWSVNVTPSDYMAWAVQSLFSFSHVIVLYIKEKYTVNRILYSDNTWLNELLSMIKAKIRKAYTTVTAVDFRVILREHKGGIRRMSPLCLRKRTEKIRVLKSIVYILECHRASAAADWLSHEQQYASTSVFPYKRIQPTMYLAVVISILGTDLPWISRLFFAKQGQRV